MNNSFALVASDLGRTVAQAKPLLMKLDNADTSARPAEGKWAHKEILGHLLDSASNNHQRFVRAQFQDDLMFNGYDQEAWVRTQKYQDESWNDLVTLWRTFNLHLAHVIESIPVDVRTRTHTRHNLDALAWKPVSAGTPTTLDYFMSDYVGHLKHHLRQIGLDA